jgi:hypothetical protein
MNIFSLAILLGVLVPALAVGTFAYGWRDLLQHFWWFVGLGAIALYLLMAMCLTWTLSNIGISGNLSVTPQPAFDPLAIRYLSFMLVWLVGGAVILFLIRYVLSKI